MEIIQGNDANIIRELYIGTFIDTSSEYYHDCIKTLTEYPTGQYCIGLLWNCLKNPKRKSEFFCDCKISAEKNLYVMWDDRNLYLPGNLAYPRDAVFRITPEEWASLKPTLPEDVYVFSDSLNWTVIFTHEELDVGKRYCLYTEN